MNSNVISWISSPEEDDSFHRFAEPFRGAGYGADCVSVLDRTLPSSKVPFQRRSSLPSNSRATSNIKRSTTLSNKTRPVFLSRILNLPSAIQDQGSVEENSRSWACRPPFVKHFGSNGGLEGLSYAELTWLEAMASVRCIGGLSSKQNEVLFEAQWEWKCPKGWIEVAHLLSQHADLKRMLVGWIREEDFLRVRWKRR